MFLDQAAKGSNPWVRARSRGNPQFVGKKGMFGLDYCNKRPSQMRTNMEVGNFGNGFCPSFPQTVELTPRGARWIRSARQPSLSTSQSRLGGNPFT